MALRTSLTVQGLLEGSGALQGRMRSRRVGQKGPPCQPKCEESRLPNHSVHSGGFTRSGLK
jgi:hypothetical protein